MTVCVDENESVTGMLRLVVPEFPSTTDPAPGVIVQAVIGAGCHRPHQWS